MATIEEIAARARLALAPPPRLRLSEWIEGHVILPAGLSATPGPVKLWKFQEEIADAIGDPEIERVSILKSVRIGATSLMTAAIAGYVANDPSPIMVLLPAEADCRDFVVTDLEPTFAASPTVAGALADDQPEGERNTLLSKRFPGGLLKIVAAKAPRNLRRHNIRALFVDEADAMAVTAEGSPIMLAEKRTLSFPQRKIVVASTPTDEETSAIIRSYAASDQRIFEVPCPHCGARFELAWAMIQWPEGAPEAAYAACPASGCVIEEAHKPAMVSAGAWRATRPEIRGHAGFKINALASPHVNASWGKLAAEFIAAKSDPQQLRVFVNTALAEGWAGEGEEIAEADLAARAEDWGLEAGVPAEALSLTCGVDVQHDRLEATFLGWGEDGAAFALGHVVIWGAWDAAETWAELDGLLARRWPHALGGTIGLDAAAIDAGDGVTSGAVLAFCAPRTRRKVLGIKGAGGFARPMIERARRTKGRAPLWIVGADAAKSWLFARLGRPGLFRFSAELPEIWFEQLCSERAVTRYSRGAPLRSFERIPGRRAEALDCAAYALAARQILNPDWSARRDELSRSAPPPARPAPVLESAWMRR